MERNPHAICGLCVPIQGKVSHRFTRMNTDQKENEGFDREGIRRGNAEKPVFALCLLSVCIRVNLWLKGLRKRRQGAELQKKRYGTRAITFWMPRSRSSLLKVSRSLLKISSRRRR